MAARRSERRTRKSPGSQWGSVGQASSPGSSFLDAPPPLSPGKAGEAPTPGISILKDLFPDHGRGVEKGKAPPSIMQLLSSVPSPARASLGSANSVPCGLPPHASMGKGRGQERQDQWEPPRATLPQHPEQAFTSYRERLRAGGRSALQRSYDIGLMPKNMKQDWSAPQMSSGPTQGVLGHSSGRPNSLSLPSGAMGDGNQMWSSTGQMQSNDYCGAPMQAQYQCMQQEPMVGHLTPMSGHVTPISASQSPMQHHAVPMQMMPQPMQMMAQGQWCADPQNSWGPNGAQMQLPQLTSGASTPHATTSGSSSPMGYGESADMDSVRRECMAIIMPQTSQFFPADADVLAAQLRASADCQCYED